MNRPDFSVTPEVAELGVIQPREVREVVFKIHNPTGVSVKVADYSSPCSCTVVTRGATEIPPHSSIECRVRYEAGSRLNYHDERAVAVYFQGFPETPVYLRVQAQICKDMLTSVPEISLRYKEGSRFNFTVRNCSDLGWGALEAACGLPEVKFSTRKLPTQDSDTQVIEAWDVELTMLESPVVSPSRRTQLRLVAKAAENREYSCTLPLQLTSPGFFAQPSTLFFGEIKKLPATASVTIISAPSALNGGPFEVEAKVISNQPIEVRSRRIGNATIELDAELISAPDITTIAGTVVVTSQMLPSTTLVIPVTGKVVP